MCGVCIEMLSMNSEWRERDRRLMALAHNAITKTPEEWREEITSKADWKKRQAGIFLGWMDSYSEEQFGPGIYWSFHQAIEAVEHQLGLRWCPRSTRLEHLRWNGSEWIVATTWDLNDIAHLLGVTLEWAVSERGTEMTAQSPELHRRMTCDHSYTRRGLWDVDLEEGAAMISRTGQWASMSTCLGCGLIEGRAA